MSKPAWEDIPGALDDCPETIVIGDQVIHCDLVRAHVASWQDPRHRAIIIGGTEIRWR